MNYNFNKKLVEQLRNGEICTYFNRKKDSLEMLQALLDTAFPDDPIETMGIFKYYWGKNSGLWTANDELALDKTPIPLSNFVQPEQSERDVMAELDALHKKYEQLKELADEMYETLMPIQYEGISYIEIIKKSPEQLVGERTGFSAKFIKQPEPKWTPKVGEWFKDMLESLYYCTVSDQNGVEGDNQNGGKISCTLECELTKPTDKEVYDYMSNLAKEKFPVGTVVKTESGTFTIASNYLLEFLNGSYHYVAKEITFPPAIWRKGQWAEIVNPVRWRAEKGGEYWIVLTNMQVFMAIDHFLPSDNDHYNSGNYFQTKEQAEEMSVLMQFTLNNPDKVKKLMNDGE